MDARAVVALLYPPACLLCHGRLPDDAAVCEPCRQAMTPCLPPVCQRCGLSLAAPFLYRNRVRDAIHAFKYEGRRRIGAWLAHRMTQTAAAAFPLHAVDAVVPVPLHWLKQRWKGGNPAAVLAQAVAGALGLPYDPTALARTRWTPTQTRLTPRQRARNVQGAFRARPGRRSSAVLLIDDVFTTGATAQACAAALRTAGAERVFVLAAARAERSA
ncbi:MAG: ComF family protein [Candidatus Omnitrophica bacterium]|nr:ComF family protein [Candidatus Omnitrophota bacterium]